MRTLILTICLSLFINVTYAQLQNWIDFETSDEVNFISTTKVSENMIPYYFEGLRKTWLPSMKYQKEKGYIKDYKVFVSDLPNSGDFNVMTWISFTNDAATRGSAERSKEIRDYMNTLSKLEERQAVVTTQYPNLRKIVGQYRLRSVTFK